MSFLGPVSSTDRIQSLDVMRGFSLLGIFIINMIAFHSPFLYMDGFTWWEIPSDRALYPWIDIFVQASVYPLFAMMFGYGLAIQQKRALERGAPFYSVAFRRLLVLLVIGCIHAFLIWSGDILINYAIFGLFLLLFMRFSGRILLLIGILLFIIPTGFLSVLLTLTSLVDPGGVDIYTNINGVRDSIAAYSGGTFSDIFTQRLEDWYAVNGPGNLPFLFISIFSMICIGAGAGKLQFLEKVKHKRVKWGIIVLTVFLVGLLLKSLPVLLEANIATSYIQDSLGGPFLAASYAIIVALVMEYSWIRKITKPLAAAGKMSLTIYLTQSIIGTLIFYSYGLGLYGRISLTTGTLLAVGIFLIQIILAEIWFMKFKHGPVEKVWRLLTYGRKAVKGKVVS